MVKKSDAATPEEIAHAQELFAREAKKGARVLTWEPLVRACLITNRCAAELHNGDLDTCILTSAALRDVLPYLGYPAEVMRVKAFVWPSSKKGRGCSLGSGGDGNGRKPKAPPGTWYGHLVAVVDNVLLDPTLDQVNTDHPWLGATPMVVRFRDPTGFVVPTGTKGAGVSYTLYPGRGGFKSAPDFRPGRRRLLVDTVLQEMLDALRFIWERTKPAEGDLRNLTGDRGRTRDSKPAA